MKKRVKCGKSLEFAASAECDAVLSFTLLSWHTGVNSWPRVADWIPPFLMEASPSSERWHLLEGGWAVPEREETRSCWGQFVIPLCPGSKGDQLPVEGWTVHGRWELLQGKTSLPGNFTKSLKDLRKSPRWHFTWEKWVWKLQGERVSNMERRYQNQSTGSEGILRLTEKPCCFSPSFYLLFKWLVSVQLFIVNLCGKYFL